MTCSTSPFDKNDLLLDRNCHDLVEAIPRGFMNHAFNFGAGFFSSWSWLLCCATTFVELMSSHFSIGLFPLDFVFCSHPKKSFLRILIHPEIILNKKLKCRFSLDSSMKDGIPTFLLGKILDLKNGLTNLNSFPAPFYFFWKTRHGTQAS